MPLRFDQTTNRSTSAEFTSRNENRDTHRKPRVTREFISAHWLKISGISVLALVPCFWHRQIVAGDLGSHVYNAWLAQLIARGEAPGLWLAHPWSNVLFDYLLGGLGNIFGLPAAEKISVALSILIFFWGTFALVAAATRRLPWSLTPLIAMITYGWTFEMGFFNYLLSLGLSFFALAILWRGKGWQRAPALLFVPFILLAHPLGMIWLVSAIIYIWLAELVPLRSQLILLLVATLCLYLMKLYLWHHFIVGIVDAPLYTFTGGDQLLLFGSRYKIVEALLGVFIVIALAIDVASRRRGAAVVWKSYAIPVQLYLLAAVGVCLLPDGVRGPNQPVALALLTERLTSVSAVLACCILGALLPRKWHLVALSAIAAVFFAFLYRDTAIVNRMEAQVVALVTTLPPGQRVLATIRKPDESRVLVQHIVDRACIGHCFSYGNYEPPSAAFRVRVRAENPYVMTDSGDSASMEVGDYTLQAQDLPAYQIYQCNKEDWTKLCIRPLEEGEDNDRLGVHPEN